MKIYKSFNILKKHKKSIIMIGNFDGVHLGHQKLFNFAKKYKKKYNLKIGVVTFEQCLKCFLISHFKILNCQN
jgi:FAD synthase